MPVWEFDSLNSRRWKRYDKLFSRKRFIIVLILGCIILFYLIPFLFHSLFPTKPLTKEDQTIQCVENFLRNYHSEIEESDSTIWISPFLNHQPTVITPTAFSATTANINELTKNTFLPLVGNGKLSISPIAELEAERRFHILGKRTLDVPIPFDPVVNFDEFGTNSKSAIISRYRTGTIEKCTCVNYAGGVISIRETFSSHRLIPSLFTQDINISNPTDAPLILRLSRKGWLSKPSAVAKPQKISVTTSDHREYSVIVSQVYDKSDTSPLVNYKKSSKSQAVAIAYVSLHDTIEVQARNKGSLSVQTFVNYTKLYHHESDVQAAIPDLKVTLREAVKKVVQLSPRALQQQHESAWKSLWRSGFTISHSHAPNAVNGYQINATLYYLLSQRPMQFLSHLGDNPNVQLLGELATLTDVDSTKSELLLYKPDRCYNGHSTLHASRLWDRLDSLSDLQNVVSLWYLTLEKLSCEHLLQSGAQGVLQAAILSLTGLRFSSSHLEFNSQPSDLQRPFLVRRLFYGNDTAVNLSVSITEENKAMIQVSLDHQTKEKDFYACDAGCLDAPVRLSSSPNEFPVKLTEPLTSLLYITSDREHVRELKHSIHVKEIGEAPAHEHHTIALHRYGHSLGGLPTFFWVTICILIVVFHLFLGKLIYNEYFATNNVPYEKLNRNIGRYSM